ncbi:Monooxygenase FAD-binding protein [Lasiodiplodia theobromae]|uniref:Monooxygenase FAD-binding protein n=1 Tax=Lasiodiplodia theobromae TaxID=45133 RepID=UPI0015C3DBFB|nr:Monooxygenase FAD-binding protein [Lasiodiplodia theobromae]KAF4544932.1 Monooxygenase FAD-binding protein [Lasiodiplodia theobromae]
MSSPKQDAKRPFRIIIVGGGIAGLSAAIALRGPNRHITILEQSSFLREVGAAISLQPNASKILEQRWGVGAGTDTTEPACPRIVDRGFRIYSTAGELVKEIPLAKGRDAYGADRVVYHRRDLHALLLHAATSASRPHPPASIRLRARVVACDPEAGTVTLASNGDDDGEGDREDAEATTTTTTTTTLTADLIIAADGIRSALRASALGQDPPPSAIPTGLSAYRFMVPISRLRAAAPAFTARIDPAAPYTSMVMGWDRRLVMGPCRTSPSDPNAGDYAVVALVPDELMAGNDAAPRQGASWNSEGELEALREAYRDFPEWVTGMFGLVEGVIGLWQLRDLEPLERWCRGRVVLVGDAAHAMLPTQGQGASQSLEDAEALGAVFEDVEGWVEKEEVGRRLEEMVACRYERATLIQAYSRQAARPATNGKDAKVTLTTAEFMDYNCNYNGARDFQQRQRNGTTMAMVNG